MIGQGPHQTKILANQELTPRDDTKKIVSEILKRVDQLIKKNDLNLAMSEIQSAKEIDPRNVYTLALEERINVLLVDERKRTTEQQAENNTEPAAPVKLQSPVVATPPPLSVATPQQPVTNHITEYRKALIDAWSHGAITPEKDIYIRQIRSLWNITEADHEKIEKEVKHECYKNILARMLANPATLNGNLNMIADLRKAYQI
jgi:septum formation inhibitor MinC